MKHYHIVKENKDAPFVVWRVRFFLFGSKVYWAPSIDLCLEYIQKQCAPKDRVSVVIDVVER